MPHHTHTHRVFDVRPGTESLAPAAVVLTSAMAGGTRRPARPADVSGAKRATSQSRVLRRKQAEETGVSVILLDSATFFTHRKVVFLVLEAEIFGVCETITVCKIHIDESF